MEKVTHPHPNYLAVFVGLVVLTVVEVIVSYVGFLGESLKVGLLVVFSLAKATLVVLYYMHLKFDNRWYAIALGFCSLFGLGLIATMML